jgi:hypothetical protein
MWNLTPDHIEQVKEELKGRRAAIQARMADELKSLDADIEEIETIERLAYAFAVKHLPGDEPAKVERASAAVERASAAVERESATMEGEPPMVARLQGESAQDAITTPEPVPAPKQGRGLSGWRARLSAQSEAEPV